MKKLPPQVNTVGLIAHYKLWAGFTSTSKVFDYSLNGHTGTVVGTSCLPKFPGFDFDGSADYIEIADHNDFTPAGTPFSISIWVNMRSFVYFIPASKWQAGSNKEWLLYTGTQKKIFFHMYDDNAYIGRTYGTSLASYEGKWTHFVATYDGGTKSAGLKIYLNGNKVDDANSESGSFESVKNYSQPVWIGRYSANYSNGLIDDVMFFNKELSVIEVKSIYEVTRWRYGK